MKYLLIGKGPSVLSCEPSSPFCTSEVFGIYSISEPYVSRTGHYTAGYFDRLAWESLNPDPLLLVQSARILLDYSLDPHYNELMECLHMVNWIQDNPYCSHCGGSMVASNRHFIFNCASCQRELYPRVSPAVIVRIVRDDSMLIVRRKGAERFGLVAGFYDPGETLEQTVIREVAEEVSLTATNPRYLHSQAWALTGTLMMAFEAEVADGTAVPDMDELIEARWIKRGDTLPLGYPGSIAHRLMDDWMNNRG